MQQSPKIYKLSLNNRLKTHRDCVTKPNEFNVNKSENVGNSKTTAVASAPRSPSVMPTSCAEGMDCTPPSVKSIPNDDPDYSPSTFYGDFSPSSLLSQSLVAESPEVGWKWNKETVEKAARSIITDNEVKERRPLCNLRNAIDQRNSMEFKLRRAEKLKSTDVLRKRCVMFQERLEKAQSTMDDPASSATRKTKPVHNAIEVELEAPSSSATSTSMSRRKNETFNDFFNDSASDGLLLEASQQVDSQLVELTKRQISDDCTLTSNGTKSPAINKQKRSSLYSKFLEDDCSDDWFMDLDDVIQQATQPEKKKLRTSFQRYNSMPTTTAAGTVNNNTNVNREVPSNTKDTNIKHALGYREALPNLTRHSSSNMLRPSNSKY